MILEEIWRKKFFPKIVLKKTTPPPQSRTLTQVQSSYFQIFITISFFQKLYKKGYELGINLGNMYLNILCIMVLAV